MKRATTTALGLLVLSATQAVAMPHCGSRDAVVATLANDHSEHHIASGLQSDTGLMEIWASDMDGSWTILLTRPDGQTCIIATGSHWLTQEIVMPPEGDPV